MTGKQTSTKFILTLFSIICLLAGFGCGKALAMGFHVQPSKISFEISPGRTAVFRIQVDNLKLDQESTMVASLIEFKQGNDGIISTSAGPDRSDSPLSSRSCLPWIQLENPSFSVPPGAGHELEVRAQIPSNATGDYYAMIGIQSTPTTSQGELSLAMAIRFLVSVEISVTGRTPRKQIKITESSLMTMSSNEDFADKEVVTVSFKNSGEVSAKLDGKVTISEILGGRSRRVASLPVNQVKITPGAEFDLLLNSPRRLPSGTYKLTAEIMADERRIPTFTQDVDFMGDPKITSVNSDAMVTVEPSIIEIIGAPKSKRKRFAIIKNDGIEPVDVRIAVEPVQALEAVAMGEVKGTELDCSSWTTISPNNFELLPGATKRVAVNCGFLFGDQLKPSSYANLVMDARYKDNQVAAKMTTLLVARNAKAKPEKGIEVSKSGLAHVENEDYVYSIEYINTGEIDLAVQWEINLEDLAGSRNYFRASLPAEDRPILPMETRRSHGLISSSILEPGDYILVVKATYGAEDLVKEYPVRVMEKNGQKHLEIVR